MGTCNTLRKLLNAALILVDGVADVLVGVPSILHRGASQHQCLSGPLATRAGYCILNSMTMQRHLAHRLLE